MSGRIGSVCSGYEGLGLAVQAVFGGELAWVADNDPGPAAILAYRFPDAQNLGDITKVDWAEVEPVEVFCAGFPCQDISAAGARAGLQRGNRSGLWHEIATAIGIVRPKIVVIENVRALLTARGDEPTPEHLAAEASRYTCARLLEWLDNEANIAWEKGDWDRVRKCQARTVRVMGARKRAVARCRWHEQRLVRAIGTVLGSLADLGYDTQWVTVPASDAGAPHRRERIFILGWLAADAEREPVRVPAGSVPATPGTAEGAGAERERIRADDGDGGGVAADADGSAGNERRQPAPGQAPGGWPRADAGGRSRAPAADPAPADEGWRRVGGPTESGAEPGEPGRPLAEPDDGRLHAASNTGRDARPENLEDGTAAGGRSRVVAADSDSGGRRSNERHLPARQPDAEGSAAADAERVGREGQQRVAEPPAPRPAAAGHGHRSSGSGVSAADADRHELARERPAQRRDASAAGSGEGAPADAERSDSDGRADFPVRGPEGRTAAVGDSAGDDDQSGRGHSAADPDGGRLEGVRVAEPSGEQRASGHEPDRRDGDGRLEDATPASWGPYEPAIRRWESVIGRPAPRPTDPGRTGQRLSPRFVEFLMGIPEGWVTDVPGLSRNAQLKALGNGVVPQQAVMALRLLLSAALPVVANCGDAA